MPHRRIFFTLPGLPFSGFLKPGKSWRLSLFLLFWLAQPAQSQNGAAGPATRKLKEFLTVKATAGEDAALLLDRYGLYEFECNITQFFKINNLEEDYRLVAGKIYKLPILIAPYNGKSIRTTLGVDDWQVAKRIETYNKNTKAQGLREDNFIKSKDLWVPWHELECPEEGELAEIVLKPDNKFKRLETKEKKASVEEKKTPERPKVKLSLPALSEKTAGKGGRTFPIFGEKYQKTPMISKRLKGRVFYIVSGHGGPDPGAQGKRGGHTLCEDEYAYDVSIRLLRLLVSHGAVAYMIVRDNNDGIRDEDLLPCDYDEEVWGGQKIPRPQRERLQQRTDLINAMTDHHQKEGYANQTLIEIHVDSRNQQAKTDVFFYYRPESDPSRQLANRIHQTFAQKYQRRYSGTVTPRHLFMLNETVTPKAVYIELGNIRNDWDQQRLVIKNNRQALANWLCAALLGGG
jgi:N-acetylmuramoyl-L-alanine amidase